MIVISTRDFRANQTRYLDMARRGEDVILKSRDAGSFRLTPVDTEDAVVSKRDLTEELRLALQRPYRGAAPRLAAGERPHGGENQTEIGRHIDR